MKIKVLTVKDIFKYLAKISIIFGIITIFANFFYDKKNANSVFSYDAGKFVASIEKEIILFRKEEKGNFKQSENAYISKLLNSEISMLRIANLKNEDNEDDIDGSTKQQTDFETAETNNNVVAQDIQEAQTNVNVEVLPSNIPDKTTYEIFGVKLRNESDYNLEKEITDLNVDFNKNDIIIFHTHTCESYTQTEENQYASTGNFRTTDLNYSVARVGDELEKYLKNYGYNVIHDKSYHDYPAYNGSYNRSLITVKKLLEENSNSDVVIDLHRDAIGDNTYAPKVKIGEDYCARIMFVIGTDGGGLEHENWRDNLKFAMKVVQKGNELYPGLFKPIIVRNSRYNHHVSKSACIIEVGATGNTLEECLNSMKYLSKIYNEM